MRKDIKINDIFMTGGISDTIRNRTFILVVILSLTLIVIFFINYSKKSNTRLSEADLKRYYQSILNKNNNGNVYSDQKNGQNNTFSDYDIIQQQQHVRMTQ